MDSGQRPATSANRDSWRMHGLEPSLDSVPTLAGSKTPSLYHDLSLEPDTLVSDTHQKRRRRASSLWDLDEPVKGRLRSWNGPRCNVLLPALLVFVITAGFGTALVVWLLQHETQSSLAQIFRDGAFLLDEGVREVTPISLASARSGLNTEGRLTGLTIASAASSAVGIVAPVSMGLYAFLTARMWLSVRDEDLPTPLQYGLLLEMLSGGSIVSLAQAGSYMVRDRRRRPRVPPIFLRVFIVGLLTHILAYLVSGVDIWLHSTTATIQQAYLLVEPAKWQLSIGQNSCQPYTPPTQDEPRYPCLLNADRGSWGSGMAALSPGLEVMSNSSKTLQTATLASANGLAILMDSNVPPTQPGDVATYNFTTFGARASCESVNALCTTSTLADGTTLNTTCAGFPSTFPPLNVSLARTPAALGLLSSNCPGCPYLSPGAYASGGSAWTASSPPPQNNYSLWLQLLWQLDGDETAVGYGTLNGSQPAASAPGVPYATLGSRAQILARCSLAFFDVTVRSAAGALSAARAAPLVPGVADGFAGPTRMGLYAARLLDDVQAAAFAGRGAVMQALGEDLARLALGSAAGLASTRGPVLDQRVEGARVVGRYPVWPTGLLVLLLWVNALVPLGVAGWAVVVGVRARRGEGEREVVELARLRLMRPAALVAELVGRDEDGGERRARAGMCVDVKEMFDEHRGEEGLRVGLDEREGRTVFGVWRRRRRRGGLDEKELEED
ncbi:hypothetical protein DENSPDRAFT_933242 [Dentipellis sp. KUC8613]|nr:hypothetical protein DENSPDRAFT_933242 [Dentipellis sp. KUC8613]